MHAERLTIRYVPTFAATRSHPSCRRSASLRVVLASPLAQSPLLGKPKSHRPVRDRSSLVLADRVWEFAQESETHCYRMTLASTALFGRCRIAYASALQTTCNHVKAMLLACPDTRTRELITATRSKGSCLTCSCLTNFLYAAADRTSRIGPSDRRGVPTNSAANSDNNFYAAKRSK